MIERGALKKPNIVIITALIIFNISMSPALSIKHIIKYSTFNWSDVEKYEPKPSKPKNIKRQIYFIFYITFKYLYINTNFKAIIVVIPIHCYKLESNMAIDAP